MTTPAGPVGEQPRILLVRPDHLGDVLLTLPAAGALRQAFPDALLTYLVNETMADVPRHCGHLDETLTLPFPAPTAPPVPRGWEEVVRDFAERLRGSFDAAIVFRPSDPWSGAVVAAAGIPLRVGYREPPTQPFLTHELPTPRDRHVALMALDLVRATAVALGRDVADSLPRGPHFAPAAEEDGEAARVLATVAPDTGPRPVMLHPGSGWPLKNWPVERWGALAAALRSRTDLAPLVVTGPGEDDLAQSVLRASGGCAVALPAPLPLGALAALHRRAAVVVGTDAGPLHLAALSGAPVVGLYGPFGPGQFAPLAPRHMRRELHVPLPCSPCGTLIDPPCGASRNPACITGIEVERVLEAVTDVLAAHDRTPRRGPVANDVAL